MKVLLDTNIIIDRESFVTDSAIGILFGWLDKLHYEKCIHPISKTEIETFQNRRIVRAMRVKLDSYVLLHTQAPLDDRIKKLIDTVDKIENDKRDSTILNELVCNRVDYLITEDGGIHDKAKNLGLSERVFTINLFIRKVTSENPTLIDYKVPIVRKEHFGNIDAKDDFFDSFKEDYGQEDYVNWFNRKSEETVYVSKSNGKVIAFLYIKKEGIGEDYTDITPRFPKKNRLKIGALKVTAADLKIGERLLKIIFDNAILMKVDEIYVTIFNNNSEKQKLVDLLNEWGFEKWGIKTGKHGEEEVYVRDFAKKVNINEPKKTFPYFSIDSNVFIVPIYPAYHTNLLPDSILRTESPEQFTDNEPFRNALSKVYVSRSWERNLKPGDLIIFYRTGGYFEGVVTTIGIVENVKTNIRDEMQFKELCKQKSVLSEEELHFWWNVYPTNRPFVVNFLYAYSLPKRLNLAKLIEMSIISGTDDVPRGFRRINKEDFLKIIKEAGVNEGIIVDKT